MLRRNAPFPVLALLKVPNVRAENGVCDVSPWNALLGVEKTVFESLEYGQDAPRSTSVSLGAAGVLTPRKRMRIRIYGPTSVLMTQPVTPSGEDILSGETHLPR